MEKGFRIGQSNEILRDAKVYDLHNSYDFTGLLIETREHGLKIFFEPNPIHGRNNKPVSLKFEGVDYLELSSNFGVGEVMSLDEMGYKNPNDHDDKWLLDEQQSTADDHLFFRFHDGNFIRVHCERADIEER